MGLARVGLPLLLFVLCNADASTLFGKAFEGDGTYYGDHGGAGHCSMQFSASASLPWTTGVSRFVALNNPQYGDSSPCGTCVALRGTGAGSGGTPVSPDLQYAFVSDECPECRTGDLDIASVGDGRWRIAWHAVQCDVGSSTFQYSFQNSNPWFVKLAVSNTRVPVASVEMLIGGSYAVMQRSIDNYFVLSSGTPVSFPTTVRLTSVLGDKVTDTVAVTSDTANPTSGSAQFPFRSGFAAVEAADGPAPVTATPVTSARADAPASGPAVAPALAPVAGSAATPALAASSASASVAPAPAATPMPASIPGVTASAPSCNRSAYVYESCGGEGDRCVETGQCYDAQWDGTCCPASTACTRLSQWYWQCVPVPTVAEARDTLFADQPPAIVNDASRTAWSSALAQRSLTPDELQNVTCDTSVSANLQCGGRGGACSSPRTCVDGPAPGACCPSGYFCQRQNEFYWKCALNRTLRAESSGVLYIDQYQACGGLTLPDVNNASLTGVRPVDGPWNNTACRNAQSVCLRLDPNYYECRDFPKVPTAAQNFSGIGVAGAASAEGEVHGTSLDTAVALANAAANYLRAQQN